MPDEIVINMLKERIKKKDCKKGFILDGFPRTIEQMKALEKITAIDTVLYFKWPEGVLLKKALGRRTCEKCGKIYNVADIRISDYHFPPISPKKEGVCDDCGGRIILRKDDNEATIKNRLEVYEKQSAPLIKYYKKTGMFRVIDVVGPPEVMIPIILKEIGYE
ncbi:MAG: nucleoside monophosphate kinase [Candidatus Aenigmarchaeota archaeon]|nr:nucleoside monophosphate kinase [Candidatus Aenigmarchaeota archaeon]